jgi:hypothetical protein
MKPGATDGERPSAVEKGRAIYYGRKNNTGPVSCVFHLEQKPEACIAPQICIITACMQLRKHHEHIRSCGLQQLVAGNMKNTRVQFCITGRDLYVAVSGATIPFISLFQSSYKQNKHTVHSIAELEGTIRMAEIVTRPITLCASIV